MKTFLTTGQLRLEDQRDHNRLGGEYKAWVQQSGGITIALGEGDYLNIMDLSGMKPLDRSKCFTSFEILADISDCPESREADDRGHEQAYVNAGFNLAEDPADGQGRADAQDDKPPRGEAAGGHVPASRRA